jgi:hypothetical protein
VLLNDCSTSFIGRLPCARARPDRARFADVGGSIAFGLAEHWVDLAGDLEHRPAAGPRSRRAAAAGAAARPRSGAARSSPALPRHRGLGGERERSLPRPARAAPSRRRGWRGRRARRGPRARVRASSASSPTAGRARARCRAGSAGSGCSGRAPGSRARRATRNPGRRIAQIISARPRR